MAKNKVGTRFDSSAPNKNKIGTLTGITKPEQFYQDLFEFKVEVNGVEQPLSKFFTNMLDRQDKLESSLALTIQEIVVLKQTLKLQQKMIDALDERLQKMEKEGEI